MKREVNLFAVGGIILLVILLVVAAVSLTRCGSAPVPTEPTVAEPTESETQPTETEEPTEPPHVHEYEETVTDPDCISGGYTTFVCDCGDSYIGDEIDAIGHVWKDATCTEPKTCAACGVTEGRANGHTWDEGIVTVPAEENKEGEKLFTCTVCKATKIQVIPTLDHVHNYEETVEITPPTCTEDGYTTHTCRCGDSKVDSEVKAPGHTMSEATCTKPEVCAVCGTTGKAALGHDWKAATCTEPQTCSRCSTTLGIPAGHQLETVEGYPATCTKEGLMSVIRCSVPGCSKGNVEQTVIPALGHNYVSIPGKEATCTEEGYSAGKQCSRCEKWSEPQIMVDPLGHDWAAATCTAPKTCNRCKITEGNPLGHSYDNGVVTYPTKTSQGHTTYTCTQCGHSYKDNYTDQVTYDAGTLVFSTDGVARLYGNYDEVLKSYTGWMTEIYYDYLAPWTHESGYIQKVIFDNGVVPSSINYWFHGCINLTNIELPNGVTSIGDYAFNDCRNLKSIVIPNSVLTIGNNAFDSCVNLTSIKIPDSVTHIGEWSFTGCRSLVNIVIPNSVSSIGSGAFGGCSSLKNIVLSNSITSINYRTFICCSSLESIEIPDSVTSIDDGAFSECSSLINITIPNGVPCLGQAIFYRCSSLQNIVIPHSVTSIGDYAFYECSNLLDIQIPNSVKSIGLNAFGFCSSLTSIELPNSVSSIELGTFAGCTSLTTIVIPNSVTNISSLAFYECRSLASIMIPDSVISIATDIGGNVFAGCNNLNSISFAGTMSQWNAIKKGYDWKKDMPVTEVICLDGTVPLN